jgi:hypothetical protein
MSMLRVSQWHKEVWASIGVRTHAYCEFLGVSRARNAGWGRPNTSGSSVGVEPERRVSYRSNCVRGALSGKSGCWHPASPPAVSVVNAASTVNTFLVGTPRTTASIETSG